MLGAVSPDSFDTLHSYSNTFQMPFVTPWFPEKVNKSYIFLLNLLWLACVFIILISSILQSWRSDFLIYYMRMIIIYVHLKYTPTSLLRVFPWNYVMSSIRRIRPFLHYLSRIIIRLVINVFFEQRSNADVTINIYFSFDVHSAVKCTLYLKHYIVIFEI